ncbi:MAG TPA: pentapeptide repeat-containing protein, partial [Bryobacteraceae bacterium]|nr:pentapeptide repeat-containing protein [Bryobacteraceae bacterium]
MVNPRQVEILRRSVAEWNQLRQIERFIPDLSDADLSGAALAGANLRDAQLRHTNLVGANLKAALLNRSNLQRTDLRNACLDKATLAEARLLACSAVGGSFEKTDFNDADLTGSDFSETNCDGAHLTSATLRVTKMNRASMREADLREARFIPVQRRHDGSDFWRNGPLVLRFQQGQGNARILHSGASSIGIETLYASHGEIPEIFLRGAGVPDSLIRYATSLVGKAIDFYSCFISYSTQDQAFA